MALSMPQVIEERPQNVVGEEQPEGATQAKADGVEDLEGDEEEEEGSDASRESGVLGSMTQWLKGLAGGAGRSKADEEKAAKKYKVRCACHHI